MRVVLWSLAARAVLRLPIPREVRRRWSMALGSRAFSAYMGKPVRLRMVDADEIARRRREHGS